jgi:hypothetical protein
MLPAITWSVRPSRFDALLTMSSTPREWPCAVSTTTRSTPMLAQRRHAVERVGRGADRRPDPQRPPSSLQARGNSVAFWKSFTVIMPTQLMLAVHDEDLLNAMLVQQRQHLFLRRASRTVIRRAFGVMT